ALGNAAASRRAFELVARELGGDAESLARRVLEIAAEKLARAIEALIAEYALDRASVAIVGGGGGAGAVVPAAAQRMGLPYRIARDAEVIAPIGVGLALVRDVVERTIVAPTPQEIASIRREASDRVVAAGAAPDRVEVDVEIDTQRNRVRATASGATALVESAALPACSESERRASAAYSLCCDERELEALELTRSLTAYTLLTARATMLQRRREIRDVRVVDERGVVRLSLRDPIVTVTIAGELGSRIRDAIENATVFGDVGRALPALYLVRGARIAAFEGLTSAEQGAALAAEEIEGCAPEERVALLLVARQA
ncbi:MAG TPA: hydantoinase/oxoprolinase family protein, partial [Candidatus Nitrosotalea sp.]|nr:hydantoinase/oxoprolinase family protein [Candidatus Nitrosotalea sp.]